MSLTLRLPPSARVAMPLAALFATLCLAAGCGDKTGATAGKAAPSKATGGAATAPAPVVATAPVVAKPPALKLPLKQVLHARVTERCAIKGGESPDEALIIAADAAAGRTFQPQHVGDGAAMVPAPAPAKPTAKKKGDPSVAIAAPPPTAKLAEGMAATPKGRVYTDDAAHKRWIADYGHDKLALETWPAWKSDVTKQVEVCQWSPERGLIDGALIDRYTGAFVEVTCLQDKHRGADGNLDEVAHAQAAIKVFEKHGFDARSFSLLGLIMAKFPTVQATVHAVRAKLCPDPRIELTAKANNGPYIGALRGDLAGTVKLVAKDGALAGSLALTPGKRLKSAIQIKLSGTIHGDRLHLNGVTGQDWVRLDCAGDLKTCEWSGQVGFKKRKGRWSYERPVEPVAAPGTIEAKTRAGPGPKVVPVAGIVETTKPAAPPTGSPPPTPAPKLAGPPPGSAKPVQPVVDAPAAPPATK